MEMMPLKPQRKAQLEEYAKRRGQNDAGRTLQPLSMTPSQPIWSGSAKILAKQWKGSVSVTKM